MYSPYYGLRKRWIKKPLKNPLSEDRSRSNKLRGTKHFANLNGTIFTILIGHCKGN